MLHAPLNTADLKKKKKKNDKRLTHHIKIVLFQSFSMFKKMLFLILMKPIIICAGLLKIKI